MYEGMIDDITALLITKLEIIMVVNEQIKKYEMLNLENVSFN